MYFQENSEKARDDLYEPQHHQPAEQNDSLNVNAPAQQVLSGNSDHATQVGLTGTNPVRVFDWQNPASKDLLSGMLVPSMSVKII